MQALSDFADQAVVLPLTLAVALALLATGRRRATRAWMLAVPGTLAAMLVLKIAFLSCPAAWPVLRSPSGHAAAAAAVYGSLAWSMGFRWAWLAALAAGGAVGASRLALDLHSPAEVGLGVLVGVLGAIAFTVLAGPAPRSPRWPIVAAVAVVLAGFHGQRLGAEAGIAEFAATRVRPLLVAPCTR